jgi:hypothetical protein
MVDRNKICLWSIHIVEKLLKLLTLTQEAKTAENITFIL